MRPRRRAASLWLPSRRQALAVGFGAACTLLGGCSKSASPADDEELPAVLADERPMPGVDADAFEAILQRGPVATGEAVASSEWAVRVREADELRVGGVDTSPFFCYAAGGGRYHGLDAGLFQLLARYVTGDADKFLFVPVGLGDRETSLMDDLVDVVFATYASTPVRLEQIDFAGPYYVSRRSIMTLAARDDVNALADLGAGTIAVREESGAAELVSAGCPTARIEEVATEEEARLALDQGRADAYVADSILQFGVVARNPTRYKIVGESLGEAEEFSIGLPKGVGAVDFVNGFLKAIGESGLLDELRQVTIDDRLVLPEE